MTGMLSNEDSEDARRLLEAEQRGITSQAEGAEADLRSTPAPPIGAWCRAAPGATPLPQRLHPAGTEFE